jgi:hypothetical protein
MCQGCNGRSTQRDDDSAGYFHPRLSPLHLIPVLRHQCQCFNSGPMRRGLVTASRLWSRSITGIEASRCACNANTRLVRCCADAHVYEVRPRKDHRGVDLISDALPFGRLWYRRRDAISNAIGYAMHRSRSHDAVICVFDAAGNVIETYEHKGEFKEW